MRTLAQQLGEDGFDQPAGSTKQQLRVYNTLLDRVYASTDAGLANQIELLPAWVEEFNSTNGGRNGRAQLGSHADPGGGPDHGRSEPQQATFCWSLPDHLPLRPDAPAAASVRMREDAAARRGL